MFSTEKCPVPTQTMLNEYSRNGAYVDCYSTEIPGHVSFSEFIYAFYTTLLFKLERLILELTVSKPSTNSQARQLANGEIDKFAAWHVERRSENELLMCDFRGRTRSWLTVVPVGTISSPRTRLYFGSAVVPLRNSKTGELSLGIVFQALLGFHKLYSTLLLHFAALHIKSQRLRDEI